MSAVRPDSLPLIQTVTDELPRSETSPSWSTSTEGIDSSNSLAEAPAVEEPRRRGRPRKVVETPQEETTPSVTRRKTKAKREESKELFPFYEQSLF